jgi:uncharacterized protein
LQNGKVLAEYGPMRLVIAASIGKVVQTEAAVRAAEESFGFFERVARHRGSLGRKSLECRDKISDPLVLRMIESVVQVGDEDLTPMAAVAGTIADEVAEFLSSRGMTKVVVDNGGDVAVKLRGDEPLSVGIRPDVGHAKISHVLALTSDSQSWGVATSGLGGRSLTRGTASAVTTLAKTASLADAAATAVANASFVEDAHVVQRSAEQVDPYTDIPGIPVTVGVGTLNEAVKIIAVEQALKRAQDLISREVILGAFVSVQGRVGMTPYFRDRLIEVC